MTRDDNGRAYNMIWKAKIPLNIKIYIWMVAQKAILTKDNMIGVGKETQDAIFVVV
jgi:hypothetical protein